MRRELREETGLRVRPQHLAGSLDRAPYLINDYVCTLLGGRLRAGDDAAAARWVDRGAFHALWRAGELTERLGELLTDWDMLPGQ